MKTVEHQQLTTVVREQLLKAIISGELKPGARMGEESLARSLGVSRSTFRSAVASLADANIVQIIPRRGSFVRYMGPDDIWEIYSLRAALEGLCATELVNKKRLQEDTATHLFNTLDEMDNAVAERDRTRLSELDVEFHRSLVEASAHSRLQASWSQIISQIRILSRRVIERDQGSPDWKNSRARHELLLRAALGGDAIRAKAVFEEHIINAYERLASELERPENNAMAHEKGLNGG